MSGEQGEENVVYTGHICNYMSIGLTARGAMLFHQERQEHPARFTGPVKNKMIYATKGCGMFCGDCCCHPEVRQRVALEVSRDLNGEPNYHTVEVPGDLSEVNILNIQSYSGGVVRTPTTFACPPSPGDGLLEVVGLPDYIPLSFTVGMCCMCSVSPMRTLAQSSNVRLTIIGDGEEPVIAQFDGEPFYLPTGAVVEIRRELNPVAMLSLKKKKKK